TKVGLSTDGGATWNDAKLLSESKSNAWRLWEFDWQTPAQAGKQTLIARATDSLGRTQPVNRDPDRGTYMISHRLPIEVEVQLTVAALSERRNPIKRRSAASLQHKRLNSSGPSR